MKAPRGNGLRDALEVGTPLVGAYLSFLSADLVEWCGLAGFDWVFLDAEHQPISPGLAHDLVRAADAAEIPAMLRVPSIDGATILQYAECGAAAIMAPHITSPAIAQKFVEAIRFPPLGNRGALSSSRAADYGLTRSARDYFTERSHQPLTIALLEDQEAFNHCESIARVEGIEVIFIGPGDLSMSLGHPGDATHPDVTSMIKSGVQSLLPVGKPLGTIVSSVESARSAIDVGFQLLVLSVGSLLKESTTSVLAGIRGD